MFLSGPFRERGGLVTKGSGDTFAPVGHIS